MSKYVLSNIQDIDIASNEAVTVNSINRNIYKLLDNDKLLDKYRLEVFNGQINPYVYGMSYNSGDIVWFKYKSPSTGDVNLYILKSLNNQNTTTPSQTLYNGSYSFVQSGWKDLNEFNSIVETDLSLYVYNYMAEHLNVEHTLSSGYHTYGEIHSDVIDNKILKRSLYNISENREHIQWADKTVQLTSDNVIQYGYYRQYDCGLIEYDIIFQLGYNGETQTVNGVSYKKYTCNNLTIEDERYYQNLSDSTMMYLTESTDNFIMINSHVENNKNKYVNVYSGRIEFPVEFIDTNYAIFTSNIRIQERDSTSPTIDRSQNALTFTNKSTSHIDPVYIMYPETSNPTRSGLINNNFHCRISGRWK